MSEVLFLCKMGIQDGRFKMAAIIKLSQNDKWSIICAKWLNWRWQNSRWLLSSSWVRMNEFESYWISLSQSQSEWSESVFEWIWEKKTRCLNPRWQCLNPTWQNSRWLPSSSWVKMNEWRFFFVQMELKMAELKMAATIKMSQVWVILKFESSQSERCFWRNLREDDEVLNPRSVLIQHGRIQDGCHHQVESEWMSEVLFCAKWLNWVQNSRWLPSSSWVRMIQWSIFVQNGWIKMAECQMAAIIKSENAESKIAVMMASTSSSVKWVWVRLN